MVTFGMPTLVELASVKETAKLCGELGLSFLELNTNFPLHQPHLLNKKELLQLSDAYGIGYTIHLNDEMAVAEFNPAVAAGYRQAVLETIAFAKELGIKKLNMHLSDGAKYTMPDRIVYFYEAYQEEYLKQTKIFRDLCSDAIGDSGIRICMENCGGYRPYQIEALKCLLESPAFGLTLDIGHNYCAGGVDEPFILKHKDRLHHMHMHDARDGRKDHLALGCGEIDVHRYMELADKCDCTVVLETKTIAGLRQSANWVRTHTR